VTSFPSDHIHHQSPLQFPSLLRNFYLLVNPLAALVATRYSLPGSGPPLLVLKTGEVKAHLCSLRVGSLVGSRRAPGVAFAI
jgi:hypothetical protein